MANTMIEAAYADLVTVERLLKYPVTDEDSTLGIIGYHLQQGVEKSLKSLLEDVGLDYRAMGHSIGKCLRAVTNHVPGAISSDVVTALSPYVNLLTDWESSGRYPSDFIFMVSELTQIYAVAQKLYDDVVLYFNNEASPSAKDSKSDSRRGITPTSPLNLK